MKISKLKNLGEVSEKWLNEIGVYTKRDMEEKGILEIYNILRSMHPECNLNFLYAMQGALLDIQWNQLPKEMKESLKRKAGC